MNKFTLSYRFLNGNVHGCVFAKNRPVSLNWTDYMVLAFQSTGMVRGILMDLVASHISLNCRVVCGVAVDR